MFNHILPEGVQRSDVLFVGIGLVYPPDGHPQLNLGNGPEKGVDWVDDSFRFLVARFRNTAKSGVQRNTSNGWSAGMLHGMGRKSFDQSWDFIELKWFAFFGYLHSSAHL